jgi:hypothetical protein
MRLGLGTSVLLILQLTRAGEYPPPIELGPTNQYGRELQRSMRLMTDSPVEKKRTVKVLLYGQSVTQEIWSTWLADYLRNRYPNANLIITNRAIGYEASLLWKPAGTDIPNFYPDLMIFHDYGLSADFEKMIELTRRRTTADILIQTDHVHQPEDLNESTDPTGVLTYQAWRNYVVLPEIAKKYGAELGDIRTYWKRYLVDYGFKTQDLLRDHVHPNYHGSYLMTELLKSYLREDRTFDSEEWGDAEKNYKIGQNIEWSDDILELDFVGNRVDIIPESPGLEAIRVHIDGKPPSHFPELYQFTRTDWYPHTYWLSILRVTSRRPLLDEGWVARILTFSTNNGLPFARFEVVGSKTGFDGEGNITEPFISNSGRVIIDPADWLSLHWAAASYPALRPLPPGHEIHWTSHFAGKDEFIPEVPDPHLESVITVAQGLANGPHRLRLTRWKPTPNLGIRIYNPLARKQPARVEPPKITSLAVEKDKLWIKTGDPGRYVLESSTDCVVWKALTSSIDEPEIAVTLEPGWRFFRVRAVD